MLQQLGKLVGALRSLQLSEELIRLMDEDGAPPTLLLLVPDAPAMAGFGPGYEAFAAIHDLKLVP